MGYESQQQPVIIALRAQEVKDKETGETIPDSMGVLKMKLKLMVKTVNMLSKVKH